MKIVVSERVEELVLLADELVVEPWKLQMLGYQRLRLDSHKIWRSSELNNKSFFALVLVEILARSKRSKGHFVTSFEGQITRITS